MDRNIQIEIKDRIAHLVGNPKIICGNNDYSVTFTFDDEWTGIDVKTLRVSYNNKYSDHVFTGNTVDLPPIVRAIEVHLGVFAGDITSTKVAVRAEPSILCEGGSIADPEPDVYNQIIDLLNSMTPSDGPGGITRETDPTVPAWAKQPEKPKYTADDVGAQPKGDYALKSEIPSVPVQSVNGKTGVVQLTADDVGAANKEEVGRISEEKANKLNEPVLIDTITVEQDVQSIYITNEPDGTPYSFKKIVVRVKAPPFATLGNWNLYLFTDNIYTDSVTLPSFPDKTNTYYGQYVCDVYDGFLNAYAFKGRYSTVYNAFQTTKMVAINHPINKMEIQTPTLGIPAGTEIEIWAVRA